METMSDAGIPCIWMRGGSSKGAYFLEADLPSDSDDRDTLLLRIFGSPDPRQIDGIGGGDPLTSKVAILSPSDRPGVDVEYLFLQVFVDQPVVSDAQGCGNILAGVGPAAVEMGLVAAQEERTTVRIYMRNTGETATAKVCSPDGKVSYSGHAQIDGVPGTHAAIELMFDNLAGSMCGNLFPTGNRSDHVEGVEVTCIDFGMPCVLIRGEDVEVAGHETRSELDNNLTLKEQIERIRIAVGPKMGLGDVTEKSVPKMVLLNPCVGTVISTRSFIPHRCHASIGVFAAISVAAASAIPNTTAYSVSARAENSTFSIGHPSGKTDVVVEFDEQGVPKRAGSIRTARMLMKGLVFA